MSIDISRIAELITKPPVELAAGPTLFLTFWGFAKGLESIVNPVTLHRLSESLHGMKGGSWVHGLQEGFQALFERLFGQTLLSFKRVFRSLLLTVLVAALATVLYFGLKEKPSNDVMSANYIAPIFGRMVEFLYLPAYIFLFVQKRGFGRISKSGIFKGVFYLILFPAIGIVVSSGILFGSQIGAQQLQMSTLDTEQLTSAILAFMSVGIASFGGLLICIFVALLLRMLLGLNRGFGWIFSFLKIEAKPIEMIGVVAGALLCTGWWIAAFVHFRNTGQL